MNLSNQDHNVKKESDPNKKKNKINKKRVESSLTIVTWIGIFVAWYLVTKFELFSPTLLPSPLRVAKAFIKLIRSGYNGVPLWSHMLASFRRLFIALGLAISTAVPLGL